MESKRPLKVLHVFGRMVRDGSEMRALELMRTIDRTQVQFHFCTLEDRPGDLDDEIRALGGEIHPCQLGPTLSWQFRRLLQQTRFDAVDSHVLMSSGFLLRLAAQAGVPVRIAHFHSTADGRRATVRRRLQRRVLKDWIGRYATHLFAVSEAAMAAAWGPAWRTDPRCRVIYNGIDMQPFTPPPDRCGVRREFALPKECRLYIHVGRFAPPKNQERLVSIFAEIAQAQPSAYLLLVGHGENEIEDAVRTRVQALGITDRVVFTGRRTDVPRLLKATDVLIFPSLWEGSPGAVLEACAAGTPVLASAIPGVDEIAAQLPAVQCLPLTSSDKEWAEMAMALSATTSRPGARDSAAHAFIARWPTLIDRAETLCLAYQGRLVPMLGAQPAGIR